MDYWRFERHCDMQQHISVQAELELGSVSIEIEGETEVRDAQM